jgi:8-oxo-dGTP pyrophosphatase MutT (NUDIX family)
VLPFLPVPIRRLGYRTAYLCLLIYWFIRRPRLRGVKCVLTDRDRVLLVLHTYGPREWDLPGGGMKRAEPPLRAARREMHEELGVCIDEWNALGEVFARMHHRSGNLQCFQAELREPAITIDLGELAKARWFPRHALPPNLGRYVRPILSKAPASE